MILLHFSLDEVISIVETIRIDFSGLGTDAEDDRIPRRSRKQNFGRSFRRDVPKRSVIDLF